MPKYTVSVMIVGYSPNVELRFGVLANGKELLRCPSEYTAKRVASAMNIVYGKKEKA